MRARIRTMEELRICCPETEAYVRRHAGALLEIVGPTEMMDSQCLSCGRVFHDIAHYRVVGRDDFAWVGVDSIDIEEGHREVE